MVSYKILVKQSAEKELRKISPPNLTKIVNRIHSLSNQPRPSGAQMLKGEARYYRIRQGDYRVIYEINDAEKFVNVIKIGHRREVYD